MKLLRIVLFNLASFEGEQVIDLESEPLKSADLFSIVGETGSGKSTILDAVCLALYGLAPRFVAADNFDYYNTDKPDNDKVLDPDDPRNILRKGARECRAEVWFLARDGFRYRAVWSCAFARVNYMRPLRRVYQIVADNEGHVSEQEIELNKGGRQRRGHKNVNNEVLDQIIGLDYGQFTRTVMLAQNSFANFVRAEDKDKAVLLEKLTGTQFYTTIACKIYELYKQAESAYNQLYDEVKAYAVHRLDEEKLGEYLQQKKILESRMEEAKARLVRIEDGFRWFAEKDRIQQLVRMETMKWDSAVKASRELDAIRIELQHVDEVAGVRELYLNVVMLEKKVEELGEELKRSLQESENQEKQCGALRIHLDNERKQYAQKKEEWDKLLPKVNEARRLLMELQGADEQLKRIVSELSVREKRLRQLKLRQGENKKKLAEWTEKKQQAELWLQKWNPHRNLLENAGAVAERLAQWNQLEENCRIGQKQWAAEEQALMLKSKELQKAEAELAALDECQKKLGSEISGLQQEISVVNPAGLQQQLDEVTLRFKAWDQARQILQSMEQLDSESKKTANEIAGGEVRLAGIEKEVSLLQQEQAKINQLIPGLEEAYRLVSGTTATALRATLKSGEPCPVCGALQHPYSEGVEQVLLPVKAELVKNRQRLEELGQLLEGLPDGLRWKLAAEKGEQTARMSHRKQLEVRKEELNEEWKKNLSSCPGLEEWIEEHNGSTVPLCQQIEAYLAEITQEGKCLREKLNALVARQKDLDKLRKRYDRQAEEWQQRQQAWHKEKGICQQRQGMQEQKRQELKKNKEAGKELLRQLQQQITLPDWEQTYAADIPAFMASLNEWAAGYHQSSVMWQKSEGIIGECADLEQSLCRQLDEEQKGYQEWLADKEKVLLRCTSLAAAKKDLLGDEQPDELEQNWKMQLSTMEQDCGKLEQGFSELSEKWNHQKGMCASLESQWKAQKVICAEQQRELEAYIAHSSYPLTRQLLQTYFSADAHWQACRERIRKADEEVKLCLGRKEANERNLEQLLRTGIDKGFWNEEGDEAGLLATLQAQKDETNRCISQIDQERQTVGGVLSAHDNSIAQMKSCQAELDTRQHMYQNWKELNDILGNANGDKFREIAQCYTLRFLVRQANEQLRMLNRRYSLEQVPDTLGIRIIDHDRADEVRNISSLSGGETFLVSLALALGLSSLSSHHVPMGNLFVDEGFGTLDAASLNMVIDALSNLQSMQGKKVGVISHTAEMRERIRTQIQVIKIGSGGKSELKIQ